MCSQQLNSKIHMYLLCFNICMTCHVVLWYTSHTSNACLLIYHILVPSGIQGLLYPSITSRSVVGFTLLMLLVTILSRGTSKPLCICISRTPCKAQASQLGPPLVCRHSHSCPAHISVLKTSALQTTYPLNSPSAHYSLEALVQLSLKPACTLDGPMFQVNVTTAIQTMEQSKDSGKGSLCTISPSSISVSY